MEAKQLVVNARDEYLKINQDEQFKKAYEKVESLRREVVEDEEDSKTTPKNFDPDNNLTNYVMNKLLELARKEGGNMFMGDSSQLNEFIFEFYTDYDTLVGTNQFNDNWSNFIRGVSNTPQKKKKEVSDTLEDADKLAAKEKKLEEEFRKKEAELKKAAIKEYKEQEAKKKEEAKAKAEAEKQKALEEAKRKEQEESETLGGMFDLL